MARGVSFQVEGGEALERALLDLDVKVRKRLAGSAVGAAARLVRDAARATVRARSHETGSLEEAIIAKRIKSSGELAALYIVTPRRRKTGSKKSKMKQKTAPHAGYVEFGTVKMAAEPYLAPALRHNARKAIDIIAERLHKGIIKEAKKK